MIDLIIDIEEFSKENKEVPKGHKYQIKVDNQKYVIDQALITGREILERAGKTPYTKYLLNQRMNRGSVVRIGYDEVVDLTKPGIEKFQTLPTDQTDGGELRKQFSLPEEDQNFLDKQYNNWETVLEGNVRWLFLHNLEIPSGYNHKNATAALKIESGYPITQLDMVYFSPALARTDNKPINALSNQVIDGKNFQRWSRHRTPQNPWRPGVDDVSTHVSLVKFWLDKVFQN